MTEVIMTPIIQMQSRRRSGIQAIFFVALAFVAPLLIFYSVDITMLEPMQLCVRAAVILYSAWMLAVLFAKGQPDWFATIFWSFSYVWLGVAGLAHAFAGRDPFHQTINPTRDTWSALVVILGMIGWHFGYWMISRRVSFENEINPRFLNSRRVIGAFWISVVLTPGLLLYLGDFQFFLRSRTDTTAGLTELGDGTSLALQGIVVALIQVPPALTLLGITLVFQEHREVRRRPAWWLMTIVVLALNVLVNNPIGVSRFWFGTVVIGWLLCWRFFRKPKGYRQAVAILIASLTLLFPYADHFRTPDSTVQVKAPYVFLAEKLDYDASAQISNAIYTFEVNGPAYGHQLISAIGFAIPRSMWEDKAEPTGVVIARAINFHFENLSAPLWAEGYVDFGLAGAIVFPALFGILAGLGDRSHRRALLSGGARLALISTPVLALYSLILLRGSLLGTIAQGVLLGVGLLLLSERRGNLNALRIRRKLD